MEMADGDRFTPEQAEALSALRDGRNVFLSGNAGTGKSYVLNAFVSDLKARNVDFLALAPTGIAALNLTDGSTIHRTLKIAPGVCAPDGPKGSRKVLDAAKVIIIDEISMCRIDLFDHVMGMISQSMTRNGAKQVVLVGDFFQLPPVVTERDSALLMKFYPGNLQGWCFKSRYWADFDFEPHVLKTVVRQSDPDFIDNLNRARVGDASCLDYFNAHSKSSRAYLPKDTLVLCANNRIADSINRENVDALDAPKVEFAAAATGTVSNGDKMAPERIVLCRGARVMSLVNSPQEGYVNGTQGTVTDASADAVTVKFDGVDEKVRIERHRWEINKSEAVVEMDDEGRPVNRVKTAVVGTYTQIPLKLAYAITIHKSQGMTLDRAVMGLRRGPAVRRSVPRALRRRPHRVPQDRAEPPDRQPRGRGVLRFPRAQDGGAGPDRVPAPLRVAGSRLHPRPHGRQGPRRPHASRPGRRPGEQQGRYPGTVDRKAGSNPRGEDPGGYRDSGHLRPQGCALRRDVQGPSGCQDAPCRVRTRLGLRPT